MNKDIINPLALMAERKIRQAMEEGRFDNLPGRGRPQKLEDLSHLPDELRLAYIILNNSGYLESQAVELPPSSLREMLSRSSEEAGAAGRIERAKVILGRSRRKASAGKGGRENEEALPAALDNPEYLEKLLKKI